MILLFQSRSIKPQRAPIRDEVYRYITITLRTACSNTAKAFPGLENCSSFLAFFKSSRCNLLSCIDTFLLAAFCWRKYSSIISFHMCLLLNFLILLVGKRKYLSSVLSIRQRQCYWTKIALRTYRFASGNNMLAYKYGFGNWSIWHSLFFFFMIIL